MRGTPFVVTTILLLVGLATDSVCAQMLGPQYAQAEQIVVLKNGEILRGRITRNAEQVIVQTPQGGRLVLPAEGTDFICNTMDEAYWGKLARTKATDIDGHEKLFQWCLRSKLLDQAQNQIDILLQSEIKAVALENLDRQLNVALMQAESSRARNQLKQQTVQPEAPQALASQAKRTRAPKAQLVLQPIEIADSIGSENLIGGMDSQFKTFDATVFRPLPELQSDASPIQSQQLASENEPADSEIKQVGFEEEVFDSNPANQVSPESELDVESALNDDRVMTPLRELDREMRSLPKGVGGYYRSRVERALIFGCSAAKCHGSDSRVLPLLHPPTKQQSVTRIQSQRNLHNVLKYVDRTSPFQSQLLRAAIEPHAGNVKPIFKADAERAKNIVKFLVMISDDPRTSAMEAEELAANQFAGIQNQNVSVDQVSQEPVVASQLVPVKPKPIGLTPMDSSPLKFPTTIGAIPKLDANEEVFKPVDPFDPEIFNRQFRKQ